MFFPAVLFLSHPLPDRGGAEMIMTLCHILICSWDSESFDTVFCNCLSWRLAWENWQCWGQILLWSPDQWPWSSWTYSDGHLQSRQEPKPTPSPSHLGDGGLKPHVLTPTNLQVEDQKGMIRLSLARLLGDLISWCFWNSFELCKQQVLTTSFGKKHNTAFGAVGRTSIFHFVQVYLYLFQKAEGEMGQ